MNGLQKSLEALNLLHKTFHMSYYDNSAMGSVASETFSLSKLLDETVLSPEGSAYEYWYAIMNDIDLLLKMEIGELIVMDMSRDCPEDGKCSIYRIH